jgi:hypothetical protein
MMLRQVVQQARTARWTSKPQGCCRWVQLPGLEQQWGRWEPLLLH